MYVKIPIKSTNAILWNPNVIPYNTPEITDQVDTFQLTQLNCINDIICNLNSLYFMRCLVD